MSPSDNVYSVFTDFSFLPQRLAAAKITPTALPLLFSDARLVCSHMSLSPDECKRLGCSLTAEQLFTSYQVLGSVPNTDPHRGSTTKVRFSALIQGMMLSVSN